MSSNSGEGPVESPTPTERLVPLDRAECILRLEAHGVGRIGVSLRGRTVIYPVNYVVNDGGILFRTRRGGDLDQATNVAVVAFEIDGTDTIYHEGWSVLVTGPAAHVTEPDELARLDHVALTPWADRRRDLFVRIEMQEISGRRISQGVM